MYPRAFRASYEDEMFQVFLDMMHQVTPNKKRSLFIRTAIDVIFNAARQHVLDILFTIAHSPLYVKVSLVASFLLISPFAFIDAHNDFQTKIYHLTLSPFFQSVSHYGYIYAIILPLIALGFTATAGMRYLKPTTSFSNTIAQLSQRITTIPAISLMLLGIVEIHVLL